MQAYRRHNPTRRQTNNKAKQKTKYQIERRLLKLGHNRHHRFPKYFGTTLKDGNMSWVKIKKHLYWHGLFGLGWPPREKVARPINEVWLDLKFLILSVKTRLFFRAVRHVYSARRRYENPEAIPREQLLESHRLLVELVGMNSHNPYTFFREMGVGKQHLEQRAIPEDQKFFEEAFDGHRRRNSH